LLKRFEAQLGVGARASERVGRRHTLQGGTLIPELSRGRHKCFAATKRACLHLLDEGGALASKPRPRAPRFPETPPGLPLTMGRASPHTARPR